MDKLHLNFYELPKPALEAIGQAIRDHWQFCAGKQFPDKTANTIIKEMFDINNAGIDIDIYPYMNTKLCPACSRVEVHGFCVNEKCKEKAINIYKDELEAKNKPL